MRGKWWSLGGIILLTIAGYWLATRLLGASDSRSVGWVAAAWAAALVVLLAARMLDSRAWIFVGVIILVALFLPASAVPDLIPQITYQPSDRQEIFTLFFTIPAGLVTAALLTYFGTQVLVRRTDVSDASFGPRVEHTLTRRTAQVALVLAIALLAAITCAYYWFIIWDNTGDSLGIIWLWFISPVIVVCAVALAVALSSRGVLAGILFFLLIPILYVVTLRAQSVNFRQLTEEHAAQAAAAIESYHAREGRYPRDLGQLFPRDALLLPGPVILYGQDWCYDSGNNYYRLGYLYREHWSDPHLVGRLYKTAGQVPQLPPLCSAEIAALRTRYPQFASIY